MMYDMKITLREERRELQLFFPGTQLEMWVDTKPHVLKTHCIPNSWEGLNWVLPLKTPPILQHMTSKQKTYPYRLYEELKNTYSQYSLKDLVENIKKNLTKTKENSGRKMLRLRTKKPALI